MNLSDKYRPETLPDLIGQDRVSKRLAVLHKRSWGGRAYWLTGQSGTGKTTIARIIAKELAGDLYITETVGRLVTTTQLKELVAAWMYCPMSDKPGYALIVNESHGLNKRVIELFLDILENLPGNVVVIFTTTLEGQDLFEEQLDSSPFASRCVNLKLTSRGLCEPFAKHAKEIAITEGLDGRPIGDYISLMKRCRNNLRMALNEIESGAMLS